MKSTTGKYRLLTTNEFRLCADYDREITPVHTSVIIVDKVFHLRRKAQLLPHRWRAQETEPWEDELSELEPEITIRTADFQLIVQ